MADDAAVACRIPTGGLTGLNSLNLGAERPGLRQGPIARIPLPLRVPAGFHGTWPPGVHIAA